jgi:hypothetical protein
MAKKVLKNLIGSWAFLVGIILAIIMGIVTGLGWATPNASLLTNIFVVIGIIIGLLNIAADEVTPFLFSGVALIIVSVFGGGILVNVPTATEILTAILGIFVPATIIVAIKNVFSMAKN